MNAVTQLEQEWPFLAGRAFRDALPAWQERRRALRGFQNVRDLLRFLHAAPAQQTDPLLLALLALARRDRLAGRFVLQAILPALKNHAARLLRTGAASYDEVWELLLFHAWERICSYPLRRRSQVAANLELDVLQRIRRELHRAFRLREHACPALTLELLNLPARHRQFTAPTRAADERLLGDAIEAGVITAEDAQLILDTRIDGVPLRAAAEECGLTYTLLRQRRLRAEDALRAWLRRKEFVAKNGAPVLTYGATSRWWPRPSRPRTRPHTRAEQGGRPRRRGVAPTRPEPRRHA
jgi:hypothetical protein